MATDGTTPAIRVFALETPDVEEIVDELHQCDACGMAQIYGCLLCVHIKFIYLELCTPCASALRDGIDEVVP